MQLAITNLSLTDELNLPYLEKVVKAGATIVLSVAQSELSKMVDLQQAVADGLAEYQVEPTAAEMASGILTAGLPPDALLLDVPEATSAVHGLQTAQGKRIERQSYENCKYQLNAAAIAGFNPAATSAADWDGAVAGSGWTADTAAHVRLLNQSTGVIYTLTTETTCTATGETALFGALLSVPGSAGSPMYRQTAATGSGTAVFVPTATQYADCDYVVKNPSVWNPASFTAADLSGAVTVTAGNRILCASGANVKIWRATGATAAVDSGDIAHQGWPVCIRSTGQKFTQTATSGTMVFVEQASAILNPTDVILSLGFSRWWDARLGFTGTPAGILTWTDRIGGVAVAPLAGKTITLTNDPNFGSMLVPTFNNGQLINATGNTNNTEYTILIVMHNTGVTGAGIYEGCARFGGAQIYNEFDGGAPLQWGAYTGTLHKSGYAIANTKACIGIVQRGTSGVDFLTNENTVSVAAFTTTFAADLAIGAPKIIDEGQGLIGTIACVLYAPFAMTPANIRKAQQAANAIYGFADGVFF